MVLLAEMETLEHPLAAAVVLAVQTAQTIILAGAVPVLCTAAVVYLQTAEQQGQAAAVQSASYGALDARSPQLTQGTSNGPSARTYRHPHAGS